MRFGYRRLDTAGAAALASVAADLEVRETGGDGVGGEAEPEEGGGGLSLAAALGAVAGAGAVGDAVGGSVGAVAAAVGVEVGSQGDTAAEEEDGVENIEGDHDDGVNGEGFLDGGRDEVEEREEGEDGDEDLVVNHGRVAGGGLCNHVADEGEDEESP